MDSYLAFDFETSGLNPQMDRIVQVGLCKVVDGKPTARDSWLVNQDVRIPTDATRVHGITTDDIKAHGIPPRESVSKLFEAMRQAPTCIGHNIHRFDVPFMLADARRLSIVPPDTRDFVDTAAVFKGWKLEMWKDAIESAKDYAHRVLSIRVKGLKYTIPVCVQELGIDMELPKRHSAMHDAYATHLIYEALKIVA